VAQGKAQALSGLGVTIFEHFQASNVVFVHSHITDREGAQVIHHAAAGPFNHVDQLATKLQRVHLEVDLEECIRDGEQGEPLRACAILRHGGEALGEVVQRLSEKLVVRITRLFVRLFFLVTDKIEI
jgi:hypothetical protein